MEPPAEDAAAPEADESAPAVSGEPAPGEAAKADEENDGQVDKGNNRNNRTLEQMMSLKDGDDERTQISKKVSWILRHGAKRVNIEIDDDGWVSVENLLGSAILEGVDDTKLMGMINESNIQKPRYEVRDTENGKCVRAVAKHTIQGMATSANKGGDRPDRRRIGKGCAGKGEDQYEGGFARAHGVCGGAAEQTAQSASLAGGARHVRRIRQARVAAASKEMAYEQQLQDGARGSLEVPGGAQRFPGVLKWIVSISNMGVVGEETTEVVRDEDFNAGAFPGEAPQV
ncbi:unnamed protein product [Prorocentrum cordatum]|uniref:2'-phosphotransferase n=1 Tax=Prorocentrum cordatum TaxID=2364126 RepID=A0ABN9XA83_9DINO|nr:unnamed protein product [Polarella glacialis]